VGDLSGKEPPTPAQLKTLQVKWTKTWKLCHLQNEVTRLADQMSRVKKLVCFELGNASRTSAAVQHIIAITIAETLTACYQAKWDGDVALVRILVQDPNYSDASRALLPLLSSQIEFVDDPEGWPAIDEHTFLYHYACPELMLEFAADLTAAGE
jgi:hypothetical protein